MLPGSSSLFVEYETDVNKLWCRLRSKERPSNESPLMRSQYIRWCTQVAELRTQNLDLESPANPARTTRVL